MLIRSPYFNHVVSVSGIGVGTGVPVFTNLCYTGRSGPKNKPMNNLAVGDVHYGEKNKAREKKKSRRGCGWEFLSTE